MAVVYGDWHGSAYFAADILNPALHRRDRVNESTVVHVGDFGLWPGRQGRVFLNVIEEALSGDIMRVCPGNHEFWTALRVDPDGPFGFTELDDDGFLYTPTWPHIRVCPRIAVWEADGMTWAMLAGANSIDVEMRVPGVDWWPEEAPLDEHIDALVDLVDGRHIDVLITHDAPASAIAELNLYPPGRDDGWGRAALDYANRSTHVVDRAMRELEPEILVCGHHHTRKTTTVNGTRVEILDMEGRHLPNKLVIGVR